MLSLLNRVPSLPAKITTFNLYSPQIFVFSSMLIVLFYKVEWRISMPCLPGVLRPVPSRRENHVNLPGKPGVWLNERFKNRITNSILPPSQSPTVSKSHFPTVSSSPFPYCRLNTAYFPTLYL